MAFIVKKILFIFITLIAFNVFYLFSSNTLAIENTDLETRIEAKNKELQALEGQISETRRILNNINTQSRTLSREIRSAENTIRNLELNIESDKINIEKLELELEVINKQLEDIKQSSDQKRQNIIIVIRDINRIEQGNLLEMFLSGESLTDSVMALNNLENLKKTLLTNINTLRELSNLLNQNMDMASNKKGELENEQINLRNRRRIIEEQRREREALLRNTRNQETVFARQLTELQRRQGEVHDEVERLEEGLVRDPNIGALPVRGALIKPFLGERPMTQDYGRTAFARMAYRTRFHNGIDYGMPVGTPIIASASGRVFAVGNNGRYQFGRYIAIKHSDNFFTLYAHMSREIVTQGQIVRQGEIIGYSGNTGFSTGPHLHFGVYQSMEIRRLGRAGLTPIGVTMNPRDFLAR